MREDHELARLIHRELRQLPPPRAPRSLRPRVMAAVQQRPRTPWSWRLVAALVLPPAAAIAIALAARAAASDVTSFWSLMEIAGAISVLARVMWEALVQPVVTYAIVFFLVAAFAGSAIWTAFRCLAFEGVSQT
jgi:hypothetical protein